MSNLKLALQIEKEAFKLMEKQFNTAIKTIFKQARTIRKLENQLKETNVDAMPHCRGYGVVWS